MRHPLPQTWRTASPLPKGAAAALKTCARLTRRGMARLGGALAVGAIAVAGLVSGPAQAAPASVLWDRWTAHDPNSATQVDHSGWDRILKQYVSMRTDGVTVVDYDRLKTDDRGALDAYVAQLEATPVSALNRDEQFAYWVNFYNALTVKVIVDNYPTDSIRDVDISPGFFADGPWGAPLVTVEGEPLTLDDMEHRILRPIWNDPRIHYAVNCAAVSCPNLQPEAYTAANRETLLNNGARAYVNDPRGVVLEQGQLRVSSIYDWFEEDFGGSDAGVIAHIQQFAGPELQRRLRGVRRIAGDDYDWSLNDVAAQPKPSPLVQRRRFSSGGGTRSTGS
ncbi:MAG: DUF547 domain-containing protein [Pseudomonadota bacterium]